MAVLGLMRIIMVWILMTFSIIIISVLLSSGKPRSCAAHKNANTDECDNDTEGARYSDMACTM